MSGDWILTTVGDVCEVVAGQSPDGVHYNAEAEGLPFYQGKKAFGERFLGAPTTWTRVTTKVAKAGDILMSVRAPVGPINVSVETICIGRGLAAMRAGGKIDRDFLYYVLLAKQSEISGNEGAVFASINKAQIQAIKLPLPALPEQKRIVAVLDEAFAGIDATIANAEKNLTNARELFESYLNSVFTRQGEGWVEKRLGGVCKTGAGGTPLRSRKAFYDGGDIPWLLSGEVSQGEIRATTRYITQEGLDNSSAKVFPEGTVVVAMYGATAGEVGILRIPAATNQAVCGILPNDAFLPEFLFYVFRHRKAELVAQAAGNAQPNISQAKVRRMAVPVLSLHQQREIVARLEHLATESGHLQSVYSDQVAGLAELKQSILHKAFAGELTADAAAA